MQLILLLLLNIFFLVVWFHTGLINGGGDTGLPFYNPALVASITKYAWWSGQGTGFSYPGILSSLPLYSVLSIFQYIGFNPFALQILFFGGVLIFSTWGMFSFTKLISGKNSIASLVTVFYLINPYSMINIWHRGAYNSMLMLVILPWTLYFLYRSLYEQRLKYLIILAGVTPFFSFAFNTPAFIATWWFVILSMWGYLFFTHAVSQNLKKVYVFFLIAFFFLWLGMNFWWLYPFFHIGPTNLFITTNEASSVANVISVSQYFKLPYALRGISTFYPIVQNDWGSIYSNPYFDVFSFVEIGLLAVSLFFSKKIKMFGLFLFIFLFAVFVSKGSEKPFGSLVVYAFALIPYLGVFRNPFEKFGVLIPLAQCFLAGYGLYYLTQIKKRGVTAGLILLMAGFLFYHWPFFTGNVFGNFTYPATVQVPTEYDDMRNWFNKNNSYNPRILHLPLALSDGIVYKWPHGYWGLEPSQLFFPGSSISHFIGFPLVDSRYQDLAVAVRKRDKVLFQSLINKFALNYIVFHKDVDFTMYRTDTLSNITTFLNSLSFLDKKAEMGNLVIYKVKNTPQDHLNVEQVANPSTVSGDVTYYPQILESNKNTQIFTDNINSTKVGIRPSLHYLLPTAIINPFDVSIKKNIAMQELPFTRFLPGSVFYPLIQLKEAFEMIGKNDFDILLLQLQDSSKRIVESNRLISISKNTLAEQTLVEYKKELNTLTPSYTKKIQSDIQGYSSLELTALIQILLRQKEVLHQMSLNASSDVKPKINDASKVLDSLLYASGINSRFNINSSQGLRIYRFSVSHTGDYQIYLSKEWLQFFVNKREVSTLIDGIKDKKPIQINQDKILIGPYHLNTGEHEIGFQIDTSNSVHQSTSSTSLKNVQTAPDINKDQAINLKADSTPTYLDFTIDNFNPSYTYLASLEFWTKQGSDPELKFVQDIDSVTKPDINLNEENLKKYDFYWRTEAISHVANLFTHSMKLRVTLNPWNNCVDINKENKILCKNIPFYGQFNRPSETLIKNVVLEKFPPNEIYLADYPSSTEKKITVSSKYINPTKYSINIDATGNSLLILNETYNDGWELQDDKGNEISASHLLVDGYANGWVLNNLIPGKYTINFISQNDEKYGIIGGVVCIIIGIIFISQIYRWKRKQKQS